MSIAPMSARLVSIRFCDLFSRILTLDGVVVEVQVLQMTIEQRNRSELVVGQLQVQQARNVEHSLWNSFITQLVVIESHKCQVSEAFEVVSEKEKADRKK